MHDQFDQLVVPIAFLLWPVARAVVYLAAAGIGLWSRQARHRKNAQDVMRTMQGQLTDDRPDGKDRSDS
jgi:hypothetical protein